MEGMTTASNAAALSPPARRARLDRSVLLSNLVSGALLLLFPALIGAWPLSVIGAVYVLAASLFLAVVYASANLTVRQEALAWIVPWLSAVGLWAVIVGVIEFENSTSNSPVSLFPGLVLGTLCYLGWQIVALAARHFMAWRSESSSSLA